MELHHLWAVSYSLFSPHMFNEEWEELKQNESFEQHSQDRQNKPSKFFTEVFLLQSLFLAGSWLSTASFREMSLSSKPGNGDTEWKDGQGATHYNHAAVLSMKLLLLLTWKALLHWDHTGLGLGFFCILILFFCKKHRIKSHIFSWGVCLSPIEMKRLKHKN